MSSCRGKAIGRPTRAWTSSSPGCGRDGGIAELQEWAEERRWGPQRRERLDWHLNRFMVHFADRALCRLWAEVRVQSRGRGRSIDKADAWIAASALALGVPLVTHN